MHLSPTLVYFAATVSGKLPRELDTSQITLIPKQGDRSLIHNYRPISLLGTVYKILAKTLANRLLSNLPRWIRRSQTGFVAGRCIFDNVFLAVEVMEWAEESHQDLVLMLLDFEKAYDRISWGFLEAALARLGFFNKWINIIMTLNREAAATININGQQGPIFLLEQTVRQGCPLAPYLFLFAADILGYMLEDPQRNILGLTLPDNTKFNNQMFADDTALYLKGNPENLTRTMTTLNRYCEASGAKVNWHKQVPYGQPHMHDNGNGATISILSGQHKAKLLSTWDFLSDTRCRMRTGTIKSSNKSRSTWAPKNYHLLVDY